MVDLVIRGGTVIDGSGARCRSRPTLQLKPAKSSRLARSSARGKEEIDARGKIVTPGFVDPHSHYDAQATWSSRITPSSWHGVTTTLIGNCGVGFAPCTPADRGLLVKLMEGVEDIPEPVLTEGSAVELAQFPGLPQCVGGAAV